MPITITNVWSHYDWSFDGRQVDLDKISKITICWPDGNTEEYECFSKPVVNKYSDMGTPQVAYTHEIIIRLPVHGAMINVSLVAEPELANMVIAVE